MIIITIIVRRRRRRRRNINCSMYVCIILYKCTHMRARSCARFFVVSHYPYRHSLGRDPTIKAPMPKGQIFQAAGIPLIMKCGVQLHGLQSGSILSRRHAHEATGAHQSFATSHRTHVPCRCLSCQHVIHIPTRSFTKGQKVVLICMGLGILRSLLSPGVAASE